MFPNPHRCERLSAESQASFTQASVAMGELGVSISDPDAPSLDILNEILNSFGGRLFNEIRSKEVSNIFSFVHACIKLQQLHFPVVH